MQPSYPPSASDASATPAQRDHAYRETSLDANPCIPRTGRLFPLNEKPAGKLTMVNPITDCSQDPAHQLYR
jgi:hypothetical protein